MVNVLNILIIMTVPVILASGVEETITINKPIDRTQHQQSWTQFFTGYVRCFCNMPVCVTTGYMCKSKEGGCFSDLLEHTFPKPSAGYRGLHGCLELLGDREQKRYCEQSTKEDNNYKRRDPKNLLVCCYSDMCNHVDSPQTKNLLNNTLLGNLQDNQDKILEITDNSRQENHGYSNSEVWFKAATIAVPICGAVILFVLIALAVKILKTENENFSSRKLGPINDDKYTQDKYNDRLDKLLRHQGHTPQAHQNTYYLGHHDDVNRQIQVPLLVQNEISTHHCGSKNETNAKLNLMQCDSVNEFIESGKSLILEIEKNASPKCSQVNLDININNTKYIEEKYKSDENVFHN